MKIIYFLPVLFLCLCSFAQSKDKKVVVGYLTISRQHSFDWNDIEYKNLTHIVLAFMEPFSSTDPSLRYHNRVDDFDKYDLKEKTFTGFASKLIMEAHNNKVGVILGLSGGFDLHASDLKGLFADDSLRAAFVKNILALCNKYNFDGVDLDYEYPSSAGEGDNITKFARDLYSAVQSDNRLNRSRPFTITLAVPKLDGIGRFFDFETLAGYCDWFNVMTYGYNAGWTKYAGFNGPLYPHPSAIAAGDDESVSKSMYDYFHLQRKVPLHKLVIGLGFYGWINRGYTELYGTKSGSVSLSYASIAERYLNDTDWIYNWSDASKVPYLTNKRTKEMLTYDNEKSIGIKCDYAIEKGFRGVMIWELSRGYLWWKSKNAQPLLETIGIKFKSLIK
ncbi:MAG: glycoside hydrolase family 18 protein [Ginsengibacter sp.]